MPAPEFGTTGATYNLSALYGLEIIVIYSTLALPDMILPSPQSITASGQSTACTHY
jgi:hypothetical protein